MRKMLVVFAAATALCAATSVLAKEPVYTAKGTIKSVDMMNHVVTLNDGSTYKIARGVNIFARKAGEKVIVTYTGSGADIEVSAITLAAD